jgi:hypothetical protein
MRPIPEVHMKTSASRIAAMLAIGILCSAATILAQGSTKMTAKDLPAAVTAAFAKAYPNATIIGVGKETENGKVYFEVESMDGKTRRDLLVAPDGTIFETEEVVADAAVPEAVKAALTKAFRKYEIEKAEKTTRGAATEYEMSVEVGRKMYAVTADATGKILVQKEVKAKKETKGEKEEKEDKD